MCVMEKVGVREIRQNLSVFLRRVRAGETFTVTDHGAPVALLTPMPHPSGDPLADLVALGRVLPAADRGGALPARGGGISRRWPHRHAGAPGRAERRPTMTGQVLFLDSSAVTKLVVAEAESDVLAERLAGQVLVGSALLVPDVSRAVR